MKWYSSLKYRPEADADIWVLDKNRDNNEIFGNLISARLGFYTYLEIHPDAEITWRYSNEYKQCEPIKVDKWS